MLDKNEEMFASHQYFMSSIYTAKNESFLDTVREVSNEALISAPENLDEIYPMRNTDNYALDKRLAAFCEFIGTRCWSILSSQGYAMEQYQVVIESMWTQEHYKYSLMEQHTHGNNAQLVGFYFLDVPEGSSKAIFHDPRAGKVQIDLFEKDVTIATQASKAVNFAPEPGLFLISNSWQPHSFSRHTSDKPLKFVHFNICVANVQKEAMPVEVV